MLLNIPCIPSLIIQIIPAILRVRQEKVPQIKIPRISNIVFEIIYHENYFDISKVNKKLIKIIEIPSLSHRID